MRSPKTAASCVEGSHRRARVALQIGAARAKSGRMTVHEMVHNFGLQLLAKEIIEILSGYMVFLRKPARELHSTPPTVKDE